MSDKLTGDIERLREDVCVIADAVHTRFGVASLEYGAIAAVLRVVNLLEDVARRQGGVIDGLARRVAEQSAMLTRRAEKTDATP